MKQQRVLNQTKNNCLAEKCTLATNLYTRTKGLLGTQSLETGHALWIARCNSIHTFFMNYAIDCVFVDKNYVVRKVYHNVKPWRMTMPVLQARSVFELPSGQAKLHNVEVGDQLNVVS